jgi:hypothetical protein
MPVSKHTGRDYGRIQSGELALRRRELDDRLFDDFGSKSPAKRVKIITRIEHCN